MQRMRRASEVAGIWRFLAALAELRAIDSRFDERSIEVLPHEAVMRARTSMGGTAPVRVRAQVGLAKKWHDQTSEAFSSRE